MRRVLGDIAADHRATVDQIAKEITDANEYVEVGEFPLLFTCYNDLSLDFLLNRAIELQKRDLKVIDECLEGLETAPRAKALVQEIRGAGLGHLDSMIERQRSSANPAAHGTV